MRTSKLVIFAILVAAPMASAQMPTYQLGRKPMPEEEKTLDIAIGTEGRELPPGQGTAKEGEKVFNQKCAGCHGTDLKGGKNAPMLAGGRGSLASDRPLKTVGSYWAYATTVYDYINRTMPWNKGGTLSPSELYAVTAYILYKNEIVQEDAVMDAKSLPKVRMPNRDGFVPPMPEWKPRKQNR